MRLGYAVLALLAAAVAIIAGCSVQPPSMQALPAVRNITPLQYREMVTAGNPFVIDVHIPLQEHLPGTDAVIAYNNLTANLDKLPQNKSAPIIVYCRSGPMSVKAAETLEAMGYTNVMELAGGKDAYDLSFPSNGS